MTIFRFFRVLSVAAIVLGVPSPAIGQVGGQDGTETITLETKDAQVQARPNDRRAHYRITMKLSVVDEHGQPIARALIDLDRRRLRTNRRGLAKLVRLPGPALAVVSAPGHLSEPVVIGHSDDRGTTRVRLWSNPNGKRFAVHSAGDVMFGRRYNAPTAGAPLIPEKAAAAAAVSVVEPIRHAFAAADLSTLNLETVVSRLPDSAAYPGKRFILNSWPETLSGLQALGTDLAILANNHARDYLDRGTALTMEALDRAGIRHIGATAMNGPGDDPALFQVSGNRVGVLAWTTVDGSFVNDSYPLDGIPVPENLDPGERWQYEERRWGFAGATWKVPVTARRIGSAWTLFDKAEPGLPSDEAAAAWQSLIEVYPELQDWVARRGHGGAARWDGSVSPARIAALRPKVDLLMVQFHAGFQFQPVASVSVRSIARKAIDAGADIVICHHPHVLQGAEWYRGRLIVYSLGNFVFDQDFLMTFASAFLRTVWEGNTLLQARLIPLELLDYRPTLVSDQAADRTVLGLWESSLIKAQSQRAADGLVRVYSREEESPDTAPAQFRATGHGAEIVASPPVPRDSLVSVPPHGVTDLDSDRLTEARLSLANPDTDILVGRDIFGWGRFEDNMADGKLRYGAHWELEGTRKRIKPGKGPSKGNAFLRLERYSTNQASVLARPIARIPLNSHRLYANDLNTAHPLDPEASYSIRLRARLRGSGAPGLRLDLYAFGDTNPTEDPGSLLVAKKNIALDLPRDGRWHDVLFDIPAEAFEMGGSRTNMVLTYVTLAVPRRGSTQLDIDNLQFLEWRQASAMPAGYGHFNAVRNLGHEQRDLALTVLPLRDP